MPKAITNTSPLLYLYRIGEIGIFPQMLEEVLTTPAVVAEFAEGRARGYDAPNPQSYGWLQVMSPQFVPSEWLAGDLGMGELETMAKGSAFVRPWLARPVPQHSCCEAKLGLARPGQQHERNWS